MKNLLNQFYKESTASDEEKNITSGDLVIEIPFPNKKFFETQFFLIELDPTNSKNNLLIPERYYYKIIKNKRYYIKINDLGKTEGQLTENSNIKFIFLDTNNKINITKYEYNFSSKLKSHNSIRTKYGSFSIVYELINSLKDKELYEKNLNFQLYLNRKLIYPEINYIIDNYNLLLFNLDILNENDTFTFDILNFYSEETVQNLLQSGYIYLDDNKIDRNYDNEKLMAVFINGKLIPTHYIAQINNYIYKITSNIKSRYDLNILNMSPKIDQIIPFYKNFIYKDYEETIT